MAAVVEHMRRPPDKRTDAGGTAIRETNVSYWATDLQGLGSQSFRERHWQQLIV
jgi:hypothetical protein